MFKCKGKQRKDVENQPNYGEENQVFGKPSVGVKTKEIARLKIAGIRWE
jgi:hypothetical protein